MRTSSSHRLRGWTSAAAIGGLLLLGAACQDQSRLADVNAPSLQASSSSLPHIDNTSLLLPAAISADISGYD